ncbi:EspF repeat-containing protein [Vulcanococcus limneticus]
MARRRAPPASCSPFGPPSQPVQACRSRPLPDAAGRLWLH